LSGDAGGLVFLSLCYVVLRRHCAGGKNWTEPNRSGGPQTHHLYDPVSRTWRATAASHINAFFTTATLLQDGTVLVAGSNYCCSASSDVFDPSSETWQLTGNMVHRPRQHHFAALLNDGTVLAVGGYYEGPPCDEGTCTTYGVNSVEVFTPELGG